MGFRQEDVEKLLVETGRRCCICKERHSVSVHHIVPRAEGGSDNIDNGVPLCPNCHDRVHSGGHLGQVVRKYTPSELKGHREATKELEFPVKRAGAPDSPSATSILKGVSDPSVPLSRCCVEGIEFARATGNSVLEQFCKAELTGYTRLSGDLQVDLDSAEGKRTAHRLVDAYLCLRGFIEPQTMEIVGGRRLMQQIKGDPEEFKPLRMIFPEPLAAIELRAPKSDPNALIVITLNVSDIVATIPRDPGMVRGCYLAGDTHSLVLRNIRTELTNRLLAIA